MSELDTAPRSFGTPEHGAIPQARPAVDPDLRDEAPGDLLEDLFDELSGEVAGTTRLKVPGRPGWEVELELGFDSRAIDSARKNARDPGFTDGVDGVKFGAILIARTCVALWRHGQRMELGGEPINFQSRELYRLLKLGSGAGAVAAVRKTYGRDADVDSGARKLMQLAGWGEDAVEADPTV